MENLRNKAYQALRWSEKYTQADMVYIAKGGFWLTFGQTVTNILSLLLVVTFANLLPKETYGLYRYILSLAGVLNIFTLTGMNRAVSRAVSTGDEGILRTSVKYQMKWNILMLLAFWVLSAYYFLKGDQILALSFILLSFFAPITAAFNTYSAYLEGKKEFRLNSIFSIISTALYVAGMITAIILGGNVISLVLTYAFITFACNLAFYIGTLKLFKPQASGSNDDVLKYGRELTFIGFIGPIASQIDKIVVAHFWGAAQLAVYTLAIAIPDKATSFIKSLVTLSFPKLTTKTIEEINSVFYKRILQGMAFGLMMTIAYVITAPYLFKYVLPQYLDAIFYSQILSLTFILAMPNRYLSSLFESQKLSSLIFTKSVIQGVVVILLYVGFGIWGGVIGLIYAQILNSIISVIIGVSMWHLVKEPRNQSINADNGND